MRRLPLPEAAMALVDAIDDEIGELKVPAAAGRITRRE
jgi:hypothetical protein